MFQASWSEASAGRGQFLMALDIRHCSGLLGLAGQDLAVGVLCSIDKIGDELDVVDDDLTVWAKSRKQMFFAVDVATAPSLATLATWAAAGAYRPAAKNTFLASADYQLVAYAHAHNHTVVTHEKSSPDSLSNIKMPDACSAMGVTCIDPFAMLRNERARFVLP